MQFPDKPTCHPPMGEVFTYGNVFSWREAETGREDQGPFHPFRTCDFCGSMHPEDLLAALQAGATLSVSDFKYGWPHKFYVSGIRHAYEDVPVITSRTSYVQDGQRVNENGPEHPMGPANGKWYNLHLSDEGLDTEAFDALANIILRQTGIVFNLHPEKGLGWRQAPQQEAA